MRGMYATLVAACLALSACADRETAASEHSQLTCHKRDGSVSYQGIGLGWRVYEGNAWYTWKAGDTQLWYKQSFDESCEAHPI